MSLILNIDTAVQSASVCLAHEGQSLVLKLNPSQKDHASWLHMAIKELMEEQGKVLKDLDAIAISAGPGSYTGLRVGMSAAKGLCYALHKPLITVNTLQMMAAAAADAPGDLLCPMIDARRMEVFTAIFDKQLNMIRPVTNLMLDEKSFSDLPEGEIPVFFGNGSPKFKPICQLKNAVFCTIEAQAEHLSELSYKKFTYVQFADLAYAEPDYGKDFHSTVPQSL